MNSDMYQNSDLLYTQLLNWLTDKSSSQPLPPPQEVKFQDMSDFNQEYLDPLEGEELEFTTSNLDYQTPFQLLDMGDIPAVQNRFQALLKRRMTTEIELNPPRFPWESEISDYEPEYADEVASDRVSLPMFWIPQLANFNWLVPMPEDILAQLLDACSQAMQLSRPQPAKMVEAVSNLFPSQHQLLNDLTLAFPGNYRGTAVAKTRPRNLPPAYEAATSKQQMVLSLLAAREIINNLTLNLSSNQPLVERQWETNAGILHLQASYEPSASSNLSDSGASVKLRVKLPKGGKIALETPEASAQAQRTYPGYVSVELFDCQPGQTYPVEVSLAHPEQKSLNFAIVVSD